MELGNLLVLGALAYGVYKIYTRKNESEDDSFYKSKYEDEKEKNADLRKENEELYNKIDPNETEHQPDLVITGAMQSGGLTYTHNMFILYITNNSEIDVEIGDFKCDLYMAGYKSLLLQPANINQVVVKPGKTHAFKLYARGGRAINEVKEVNNEWSQLDMGKNIPVEYAPVELDIAFLWFYKGGYEQVRVYNVPCSFEYKGAGWTVSAPWVGYNRAKNQEAGSLWNAIESEENGEE